MNTVCAWAIEHRALGMEQHQDLCISKAIHHSKKNERAYVFYEWLEYTFIQNCIEFSPQHWIFFSLHFPIRQSKLNRSKYDEIIWIIQRENVGNWNVTESSHKSSFFWTKQRNIINNHSMLDITYHYCSAFNSLVSVCNALNYEQFSKIEASLFALHVIYLLQLKQQISYLKSYLLLNVFSLDFFDCLRTNIKMTNRPILIAVLSSKMIPNAFCTSLLFFVTNKQK